MSKSPALRVIQGGPTPLTRIESVEIYVADDSVKPLIPIDVQIIEEDTWQVLSADASARETDEHPIRLMTSLIDQQPLPVGEVIVSGHRWKAVIADFDQDTMCKREWIDLALQHIHQLTRVKRVKSLQMPLLGYKHGWLTSEESLESLVYSIRNNKPLQVKRIWLTVTGSILSQVEELLLHWATEAKGAL